MRQDRRMGLLNFLVNLVVPDQRSEPTQAAAPVDVDGSPRWTPLKRPAERKGKRKTAEELEAERANLAAHMQELAQKRIAREFPRAQAAGITHYRWRSMGDSGGACPTCVSREAIVLLGDIQAHQPLHIELSPILNLTDVWFIHGNHDTDSDADYDNLWGSELADRNLHGRFWSTWKHFIAQSVSRILSARDIPGQRAYLSRQSAGTAFNIRYIV